MAPWSARLMPPASDPTTSADQTSPADKTSSAWLPAPVEDQPPPEPHPPPFGILLGEDDLVALRILRARRRQQAERLEEFAQPEPLEEAGRGVRWSTAGPVLLSLAALALWVVSLARVNLRQVDDFGLATVLPVSVLLALVLATAAFAWTLGKRPLLRPVLLLQVVVLVVMLYGMNPMVEPVPGPNILWRHAGIADHIATTGTIDPRIDAYFNWPGFFVLAAFLSSATGLNSILQLGAAWAPVFFNLLFLGPLLLLYRRATSDHRLIWLAIWFFYITNWIQQDYLAPQALTYFLYLLILGILLRWFGTDRSTWPAPARFLPWRPPLPSLATSLFHQRPAPAPIVLEPSAQRAGLMAVVIVLFAAAVPSHQLTPFAILVAVSALVIVRRCSARGLPLLMLSMMAAWITFMSAAYLTGHLSVLSGHVGQVNSIAAANVTDRLTGSSGHQFVVQIRLALTALLWMLALLGWLRRRRQGQDDVTFTVLAVAPFLLMGLQSYGGELLLRVYLFGLPFVAFLAAGLFLPVKTGAASWRTIGAIGLAGITLLSGFMFARYGNERIDHFSSAELAAVRHLYEIAPPGSLLLAATPDLPWKFQDYAGYVYRTVPNLPNSGNGDLAKPVLAIMRQHRQPGAYLIVTRSQRADAQARSILPPGSLDRLESKLRRSPAVQLVYANQDAQIYTLRPGKGRDGRP
jgi:hypothetical protein